MVVLTRFHEEARSRDIDRRLLAGEKGPFANEGPLNNHELKIILGLAWASLSGFFLGFWFLLRIVWHY